MSKGHSTDDPFLSFIKGHSRYEETNRDGMQFVIELRGVDSLFPHTNNPSEFFTISHKGKNIQRILNEHFISRQRYGDRLYGHTYDLGGFFGSLLQQSAIHGEHFYEIDWKIYDDKNNLILVDDFRYLHSSTMHTKRDMSGNITGYSQRYSRISFKKKTYGSDLKNRVTNFEPTEILRIEYPFGSPHPVKKSLKLLKTTSAYWKFNLDYARSAGSKIGMPYSAEKAKYKDYSREIRKYKLTKAKISKNFHQIDGMQDLSMTAYYDVYNVCNYLEFKMRARQFMVDEFNKQVLAPLAAKNNIKSKPILKIVGLSTESDVTELMKAFQDKVINYPEFIELLKTIK